MAIGYTILQQEQMGLESYYFRLVDFKITSKSSQLPLFLK